MLTREEIYLKLDLFTHHYHGAIADLQTPLDMPLYKHIRSNFILTGDANLVMRGIIDKAEFIDILVSDAVFKIISERYPTSLCLEGGRMIDLTGWAHPTHIYPGGPGDIAKEKGEKVPYYMDQEITCLPLSGVIEYYESLDTDEARGRIGIIHKYQELEKEENSKVEAKLRYLDSILDEVQDNLELRVICDDTMTRWIKNHDELRERTNKLRHRSEEPMVFNRAGLLQEFENAIVDAEDFNRTTGSARLRESGERKPLHERCKELGLPIYRDKHEEEEGK